MYALVTACFRGAQLHYTNTVMSLSYYVSDTCIEPGRLAAWLKDVGAALYSDHFIYRHSLLYYAVHSLPTGYR